MSSYINKGIISRIRDYQYELKINTTKEEIGETNILKIYIIDNRLKDS